MKRGVYIAVLVGVIVVGAVLGVLLSQTTLQKAMFQESEEEVFALTGETKTFNLIGQANAFYIGSEKNPTIRVNWGDVVVVNLQSSVGFHDWSLSEYNLATQRVNPGQTSSVEFVADQKGRFLYYCSVGAHRDEGMVGILLVE